MHDLLPIVFQEKQRKETNFGPSNVNLSLLALPYSRISLVQGGDTISTWLIRIAFWLLIQSMLVIEHRYLGNGSVVQVLNRSLLATFHNQRHARNSTLNCCGCMRANGIGNCKAPLTLRAFEPTHTNVSMFF